MKQDSLFFLLILVVATSFSCRNTTKQDSNNGKDTLVKKEYYANGKVKEELYKNNDTIYTFEYYPSGKLKEEFYFYGQDSSLFCGYIKQYFESGIIKTKTNFERGKKYLTKKEYYSNKDIAAVYNYLDMQLFGESLEYFDNMKIKGYYFRTFGEQLIYYRDYDSLGNIIEEKGFPMASSYNKNSLLLNDTLRLWIVVGLLKDWDIKLLINDITDGSKTPIKTVSDPSELEDSYFGKSLRIHYPCITKGTYKWEKEVKIVDKKYNKELSRIDTLIFTVR